jgi:Kelch motif
MKLLAEKMKFLPGLSGLFALLLLLHCGNKPPPNPVAVAVESSSSGIEVRAMFEGLQYAKGADAELRQTAGFTMTAILLDSNGRGIFDSVPVGENIITVRCFGFSAVAETLFVDSSVTYVPPAFILHDTLRPVISAGSDTVVPVNFPVKLHFMQSDLWYANQSFLLSIHKAGDEAVFSSFAGGDTIISFPDTGIYFSIYRVQDLHGNSSIDTAKISVVRIPPVVDAGNDTVVAMGGAVGLTAKRCYDIMGSITKYEWDIGCTGSFSKVATGDTTIIINAEKTLCALRVTDCFGFSAQDSIAIYSFQLNKIQQLSPFSARYGHTATVFNGKIWIIGGASSVYPPISSIWSSTDGATWTKEADSVPFGARYEHTTLVYSNRIWVIAGSNSNGHGSNDVWSSADGKAWECATYSAAFPLRASHGSVVFQDKMWIIGGMSEIQTTPTTYYNDVWYSTDGKEWTCAVQSADFSRRADFGVTVLNGKIFVIDGELEMAANSQVWSSADGITWGLVTDKPEFQIPGSNYVENHHGHSCTVWNDNIFFFGGYVTPDIVDSSLYFSGTGKNWCKMPQAAQIGGRAEHACVEFNGNLWFIGGTNINRYGTGVKMNDVWMLQ